MLILVQVGRRALEGKLGGTIFTLDRIHIVLSGIEEDLALLYPGYGIILSLSTHDESRVAFYGVGRNASEAEDLVQTLAKSIEAQGILNPAANPLPLPLPKLKLIISPTPITDAIRELL